MTLLLPLPLGPTTDEKDCAGGASAAQRGDSRPDRPVPAATPRLVERPDTLLAGVRLEVVENHLLYHQPRRRSRHGCGAKQI